MKKLFLFLAMAIFALSVNAQIQNQKSQKTRKVYIVSSLEDIGNIIPMYVAKVYVSGMPLQTLNDSILDKKDVITDAELINFFAEAGWSVVTGVQSGGELKWVFEKEAADIKSAIIGLRIKKYNYSR